MTTSQPHTAGCLQSRSVERLIHADRQTIFDVLADPFQHHLIDGSDMVSGEPHGPGRLSHGTRFTMGMRRWGRVPYRSVNEVVEFEEPRLIAWATTGEFRGKPFVGGHRWRYELESHEEGTIVRETYDWSTAMHAHWTIEKPAFPDRFAPAMAATLKRLAELVENPQHSRRPA
ncbi:SRPBCC family protein [Austwickia chelonae]|uniref:SRPBCC family protein n=1 Tax=Austwickia chelonae TaxID=100225 RepID=UPI000E21ECF3|nr:SRPBCC family protein [Austwickia chelonae]